MFDTEKFIGEVRKKPCLWNMHLDTYSNRVTRQQAWVDIAGVIFDDWDDLRAKEQDNKIKDLQKKWKSLRDYYNREKYKITEVNNDEGLRKKRNAPFLNMLRFLSTTKISSNDATQADSKNSASSTKMFTDKTEFIQETTHMTVCQNTSMNSMQNQNETDPNMSFLITILPDMRSMDEKQNFEFRLEVMNLIKRIKYDEPVELNSKSWFTSDE